MSADGRQSASTYLSIMIMIMVAAIGFLRSRALLSHRCHAHAKKIVTERSDVAQKIPKNPSAFPFEC